MEIKSIEIVKATPYVEIVLPGPIGSGGGIVPAGTLNITANGSYNVSNYANVSIAVPDVGITPTGTKSITANGNYDVKNYANASVNVPNSGITPSGTLQITQNGTVNVTNYAQVVVNVPTPTDDNDFDSNTQDATAGTYDLLENRTAYVKGKKIIGTMPIRGAVTSEISTANGEYTIPNGYHSGNGKVKIAASEQQKLIPENIKAGISILGVAGTLEAAAAGGGDDGSGSSGGNYRQWDVTIASNQTTLCVFVQDDWLKENYDKSNLLVAWIARGEPITKSSLVGGFKFASPLGKSSNNITLYGQGARIMSGNVGNNHQTDPMNAVNFAIGGITVSNNGALRVWCNSSYPVLAGNYTAIAMLV